MRALRTPFLAALLGGALVAGSVVLLEPGSETETRTVVQQAPASARPAAVGGDALTAGEIYDRASPGVVFIEAEIVREVPSPFGLPSEQRGQATGSGFVIDREGRILTNYHVIAGASQVTVDFEDDESTTARVLGTDPSKDLALLKVDPEDAPSLKPLPLGDSDEVRVGDPALALGNPFGLDRTLTSGIVSALQRFIEAPNGFTIQDVIQTDAAVNPGNSGGPLLDATGRVIGINSQIATGGAGGNVGIGFAVPIDVAKRDLPALEKDGRVKRPWLGVVLRRQRPAGSGEHQTRGALIAAVAPNSPAARAGIQAGSVVLALDAEPLRSPEDLISAVARNQPGDDIELKVVRRGERQTIRLKLGEQPTSVPFQ